MSKKFKTIEKIFCLCFYLSKKGEIKNEKNKTIPKV